MLRRALFACLLAATVSACSAGTGIFGPSTGTVTGHVQIRACGGANRPEQTGCPVQPMAGQWVVFQLDGASSATTATTDAKGAYRLDLKPGTYRVHLTEPGSPPVSRPGSPPNSIQRLAGPSRVVVTAGKTITADFIYTIELL